MSEISPRAVCLKLLVGTERGQEYSNIALDAALKKYPLRPIDKRFVSALYYGVTERRITLDAVIKKYSSRPSDRLGDELRQILRMGIYQILYMDSVPESAAVNESVKLAVGLKNKNPFSAGFVNALLRSFIRDGSRLPECGNKYKDLEIKYSVPEWIIRLWEKDYGENRALSILKNSLGPAPNVARLNTLHRSEEEILSELSSEGVTYEKLSGPDCCYELKGCGSVEELKSYKDGFFHIQDYSCQICCRELDPRPGEVILDLCSAPGGKAFTLAEIAGGSAEIYAYDLHKNRVKLIESGAERLGIDCITASANDAKRHNGSIPKADRILLDVPCSGLGVIRRKPEIKYRPEEEIKGLPEVQKEILDTSADYLKPGGILIYSTCTLRKAENDIIAEDFLRRRQDFEPVKLDSFTDWKVTLFPGEAPGDGFFIAKFRRKR